MAMSWRLRSVRRRILLLVLVPVLSLFGLFLFTTSVNVRSAINLARARTLNTEAGQPVGLFQTQVDTERTLAVIYVSAPNPAILAKLTAQEPRTMQAVEVLRTHLTSADTQNNASAAEKQAVARLLQDAGSLNQMHKSLNARTVSRAQVFSTYGAIIQDASAVFNQVILQVNDPKIVTQADNLVRSGQSQDALLQENALLLGDFAARKFPATDRRLFTQLVGARRAIYAQSMRDLDPVYRAIYQRDISSQVLSALTATEDKIIATTGSGALPRISPQAWAQAVGAFGLGSAKAGNQAAAVLDTNAANSAKDSNLGIGLTAGAGLLAVILSVIVAVLVGRGLVTELRTVRDSALDVADRQLPDLVDKLASGADADVPHEAPRLPATTTEVSQVADAFARVHRTAVEAAVGQARLREGISDVFRNLARRSQSLLHRQLALIDSMERRAKDPQQLDDLFRIDHLTTRMRRHAESLIILSGHAPGRGWRNPVPLVDVLRAAIAEVEDYTRIKVISATQAALAGPAVGDVIHMIAELAENATIFSPPNTPVIITGDIVGQGFAVEIEDRGLGLSEEKLADINQRLASPPPFDPSGTDQLGLFVAARLAQRHGIKISLRASPYGGTSAIVLIPNSLVVPEGALPPGDAPALEGTALGRGRHAGRDNGDGALSDSLAAPDSADILAGNGHSTAGAPAAASIWGTDSPATDPLAGPATDASGLPRRVRQASLVPQLRDNMPQAAQPEASEPAPGRSPEDTRSALAAIQRGWERGRSLFEPPPGRPPSPVPPVPQAPHPDSGNGQSVPGGPLAGAGDGQGAGVTAGDGSANNDDEPMNEGGRPSEWS
jgi:signal transduction histidine kinase